MPPKPKPTPLNPGEAKTLKAAIFDLSELSAKQALYGIIQTLSVSTSLKITHLKDILDDANKLTRHLNQHGK